MANKISRRVREEAATICAIAASTPDLSESYSLVARSMGLVLVGGFEAEAESLAFRAWQSVGYGASFRDAEAEALLRCGFTPEGWSPE